MLLMITGSGAVNATATENVTGAGVYRIAASFRHREIE